ncbi:Gfo/Idh/MocA family oxidoreductase [Akkermansiaceae bacterium]|nr:Gfo/Idh/MocA family oxidoreductase [Akkermansiaceae bacterium]MDA7936078.1 Gfo/Idh/MocA family oxidoreductase [bacterium]MDC1205962.1 Gfo/Idh/MocA family oxidoreductase [Akkermansiaceae bacterium]
MTKVNTKIDEHRLRIAIIGAGAIADTGHLPGAKLAAEVEVTVIVDKDEARARDLATKYDISEVRTDLEGLQELADVAILCLPHHLHHPISLELIEKGMHLLVEKPMALNVAECDAMIDAAEKKGVVLSVGMMRRYFRCNMALKEILTSGILGQLKSFEVQDGGVYAWPSASPFILSRAHSGGGVLMGNGSHVMESVLWWFGNPSGIVCQTNSAVGMETDAEVDFEFAEGFSGRVELSRTRQLKNRVVVEGERGKVEIPLYGDDICIWLDGMTHQIIGNAKCPGDDKEQTLPSVLADQLRDLVRLVRGEHSRIVTGREARVSIACIESCYNVATPSDEPWASTF